MTEISLSYSLKLFILFALTLAASHLTAETLEPGKVFPEIEATDQHEVDYPMPDDTQFVAVTFTMSAGKNANKYFSEQTKDYLPKNKAVFLSNIDGMPAVARVFAMPKMQKYEHRIMLADEKGLLDPFPQAKGKVTIFTLGPGRKIVDIRFWDPKSGSDPFKKS